MKTSQTIGKVLLTFFSGTIIFVGYLYYLGATVPIEPIEETLVDGQWVQIRGETNDYPGIVQLFTDNLRLDANVLYIAGEAQSAWFSESRAPAEIIAPDGTVLWEGVVATDERYIYDMVVPFDAEAVIDNYVGEATFVIYTVAYTEENPDEPVKEYSYSTEISIAAN